MSGSLPRPVRCGPCASSHQRVQRQAGSFRVPKPIRSGVRSSRTAYAKGIQPSPNRFRAITHSNAPPAQHAAAKFRAGTAPQLAKPASKNDLEPSPVVNEGSIAPTVSNGTCIVPQQPYTAAGSITVARAQSRDTTRTLTISRTVPLQACACVSSILQSQRELSRDQRPCPGVASIARCCAQKIPPARASCTVSVAKALPSANAP